MLSAAGKKPGQLYRPPQNAGINIPKLQLPDADYYFCNNMGNVSLPGKIIFA
jgi:hypothetical protein